MTAKEVGQLFSGRLSSENLQRVGRLLESFEGAQYGGAVVGSEIVSEMSDLAKSIESGVKR